MFSRVYRHSSPGRQSEKGSIGRIKWCRGGALLVRLAGVGMRQYKSRCGNTSFPTVSPHKVDKRSGEYRMLVLKIVVDHHS